MVGKTMIVRFIALGPANSIFTILGLQCTDSWYVAHSEDLLYRPGYDQFVKAGPQKRLPTSAPFSRKTKRATWSA